MAASRQGNDMKKNRLTFVLLPVFVLGTSLVLFCCGGSGVSDATSTTTTTTTRAVDANTSTVQTIPVGVSSCAQLSRDTTDCQATRTAMGFSGNWLKFSCNVVLGL